MQRSLVRKFSMLTASILLLTLCQSPATAASVVNKTAAKPAVCTSKQDSKTVDVTFLTVRGSNPSESKKMKESQITGWDTTPKYMTSQAFYNSKTVTNDKVIPIVTKAAEEQAIKEFKGKKVNFKYAAVSYPAWLDNPAKTGVFANGKNRKKYNQSVEKGRQGLYAWSEVLGKSSCNTRVVIIGYSQGAQIVHEVLQNKTLSESSFAKKVKRVVLMADPIRNAEKGSAGIVHDPGVKKTDKVKSGRGALSALKGHPIKSGWHDRVLSYCNLNDTICNGKGDIKNYKNVLGNTHLNYNTRGKIAGAYLATKLS